MEQSNFHDYNLMRMSDLPEEMHVAFIDVDTRPTGLGEIGNPFIAGAISNAFYRLTGKRLRHHAVHARPRAGDAQGVSAGASRSPSPQEKRPPDRRAAGSVMSCATHPGMNRSRVWKSLNVLSGTWKLVASRRCGLAPIQSASEIDW